MCENKVYKNRGSFATVLNSESELKNLVDGFWNSSLVESDRECFPDVERFLPSLSPAQSYALLRVGYEAVALLREQQHTSEGIVPNELVVGESFQSDLREVDMAFSDLLKRVARLEKFRGDTLCWAGQVSERLSALKRVVVQ